VKNFRFLSLAALLTGLFVFIFPSRTFAQVSYPPVTSETMETTWRQVRPTAEDLQTPPPWMTINQLITKRCQLVTDSADAQTRFNDYSKALNQLAPPQTTEQRVVYGQRVDFLGKKISEWGNRFVSLSAELAQVEANIKVSLAEFPHLAASLNPWQCPQGTSVLPTSLGDVLLYPFAEDN